jgi:glycosyltransferase involved in cell wall biosynthesis
MEEKVDISVVVPIYNEERLIRTFIENVDQACRETGLKYEIIPVENGSTDNTAKIVGELVRKMKTVRMISLPKPSYGEALLYGAKKARGKFIAFFNADFWDKKLLEAAKLDLQKYDMVIGSKMLPDSEDLRPITRKILSRLFNKFLNIFFGYPGTETHGIKVLRRKTVMPIFESCKTRSGIIDTELMVRAYRKKLIILEIPVKITEVRPARFGLKRLLLTPIDMWNLAKALS